MRSSILSVVVNNVLNNRAKSFSDPWNIPHVFGVPSGRLFRSLLMREHMHSLYSIGEPPAKANNSEGYFLYPLDIYQIKEIRRYKCDAGPYEEAPYVYYNAVDHGMFELQVRNMIRYSMYDTLNGIDIRVPKHTLDYAFRTGQLGSGKLPIPASYDVEGKRRHQQRMRKSSTGKASQNLPLRMQNEYDTMVLFPSYINESFS